MANTSTSGLLRFALIFAVVYLGSQLIFRMFFPEQFGGQAPASVVSMEAVDDTVKGGHHPKLTIQNATDQELQIVQRCPMAPVDVWFITQSATGGELRESLIATEVAVPCAHPTAVAPGAAITLDLGSWKYSLFSRYGLYEVQLPQSEELETGTGAVVSGSPAESQNQDGVITARFTIEQEGVITQMFRAFVTKPLLNLLILIASLMPGYNLGLAIILLTILVKLVLFIPTQHGLEGQKKMQAIQPKLEAIKKQHKGDAAKINEETMKLWKEHKINPFQSCLPLLIQFPVLIGLFFVIRDGSILALSRHLLYVPYSNLPWTFGTDFLGLNLLEPNAYIFPPLLVVLQFLQMKLTFAITERKKRKDSPVIDVPKKGEKPEMDPQKVQQQVMTYGLPLMIGFFAINFPSAVSLYWGVSTIFAIGQQLVVNRKG